MTREEVKSCIGTIELLRRLAFNVHGVMDVIDAQNCDKIIALLSQEPCEDAVSRQAVFDAHEKVAELFPWRVPGKYDTYDRYNEAWHDAIGRAEMEIEGLPPVNPQPKTGHWIPVSERFPESCGMYIVTRKIYDCPDTAPFMMSDESWFDGQNTWHNDNRINHKRGYLTDVIAWMPLPKPYEPAERSGKE